MRPQLCFYGKKVSSMTFLVSAHFFSFDVFPNITYVGLGKLLKRGSLLQFYKVEKTALLMHEY